MMKTNDNNKRVVACRFSEQKSAKTRVFTNFTLLIASIFIFSGCKLNQRILGIGRSEAPPVSDQNDFAKIDVTVGSPVAADGTTQLVLTVYLKNSDDSPVVGFTPSYNVETGEGVTSMSCTASDASGVSICTLQAG